MVGWGGEFSFFHKNWFKNWYVYFYKPYAHQIWEAGTFRGNDPSETNEAGNGDVITSISRWKLKTYIHCQKAYDHQT